MFDTLSDKFASAFKYIQGKSKITEENIEETLKEVRTALLEADVNFKVVKDFINSVKEKALGEKVIKGVNPGEQFIKIMHDELARIAGRLDEPIRVAIAGTLNAGKSTLVNALVGEDIAPTDATEATRVGRELTGWIHLLTRAVEVTGTAIIAVGAFGALGLFLFTGDDVLMPISTLSGGEKGRVALTKLMLKKDNVLLLDEPTNHLDMDSREVLEDALENFPGTILAISHDRYFINRFATKVCVLEAGGVKEYLGNYDDYFEKINRQQAPDSENAGMTKTAMDKEKRKSREEEKRIREKKNAIAAAEKAIATAEEEAAEMEAQLADPATYQDAEKAAQLAKAYQLKKDEIERRYAEWEALSAEE